MSRALRSRRRRWYHWAAAGSAFLLVVLAIYPAVARAIDDPTSITIERVLAYQGVLEASDLLVVVKYDIQYASLPSEDIGDTYIGRFRRGTSELASVEPVSFNDRGWGVGAFSFYWTADQVTSDSIEFSDTNSEGYTITLQGQPGQFPGQAPSSTTTTITWQSTSNPLRDLFDDVVTLATELEQDARWITNSYDLIAPSFGQQRLTANGESYFTSAIPNLHSMIPLIFEAGTSVPSVIEREHQRSYDDTLDSFWAGTWVLTRFENMALWFRVPIEVVKAGFAFFFMALIAFGTTRLFGESEDGAVFGMSTFAVSIPLFASVDLLSLTATMIIISLAVVGIGFALFLRRAGS